MRNQKGVVDGMLTGVMVAIVATVASTGALFGAMTPQGSAFLLATTGAVAYSQTPHVVEKFREKKAIGMCEDSGAAQCTEMVKSWSEEDVLDYIRDDDPGTYVQWSDMAPRLGGSGDPNK